MAGMTKGFAVVEKAVKSSFDRATKATVPEGPEPNTDVKFYEDLTPEAFDVIAATYGPDNLVAYVQAMEIQRMKGMTNGKPTTRS